MIWILVTRCVSNDELGAIDRKSKMTSDNQEADDEDVEKIRDELVKASPSTKRRVFEKFISAALGSIPWVGGFLSAAADFKFEEGDLREDNLQTQWLEEHTRKLGRLSETLNY